MRKQRMNTSPAAWRVRSAIALWNAVSIEEAVRGSELRSQTVDPAQLKYL
ncbi:hypothetical protein ACPOL_6586 [Acidisarcina polymorpha]|uniref:Uncharacterized protein n=1 Tax=Acidisarcina polymorpha TaxID=2211140 RepID=A0A2Z5GA59_9BACT|nr:hypothetical protein ACPOL_6586 [Acidisarcina polymorpha]